jgi:general secretion pathway protein G
MVLRQRKLTKDTRHGFTLLEVMVVVTVILLIAGLGVYNIIGQANKARRMTAIAGAKNLQKMCENYSLDHRSQWPTSLDLLLQKDQFGGPYLTDASALNDPWGNRYMYQPPSDPDGVPMIWSESPYGRLGNVGNATP